MAIRNYIFIPIKGWIFCGHIDLRKLFAQKKLFFKGNIPWYNDLKQFIQILWKLHKTDEVTLVL